MMSRPDVVVYTGIFQDYDVLMEPQVTADNVDYVCFTDDADIATGVWEARTFPDAESPRDQTARAKMLPHEYFPKYDYCIWVDGNLWLTGDVTELIDDATSDIVSRRHPERDCVYDEAAFCAETGLANPETVRKQMDRYRAAGFPESYGLSDVAILLRRHTDPEVKAIMETWWREFQCGSTRTQLSFEYALWKHDYEVKRFDIDFDDSAYFRQFSHKPDGVLGHVHEVRLRALEQADQVPYLLLYAVASVPAYVRMSRYVLRTSGPVALVRAAGRKAVEVTSGLLSR